MLTRLKWGWKRIYKNEDWNIGMSSRDPWRLIRIWLPMHWYGSQNLGLRSPMINWPLVFLESDPATIEEVSKILDIDSYNVHIYIYNIYTVYIYTYIIYSIFLYTVERCIDCCFLPDCLVYSRESHLWMILLRYSSIQSSTLNIVC